MASLKDYLVPLTMDGEVPPEIYVALRGTDTSRVKRMWINANNPFALAKAVSHGSAELVGKPSSVYLKQFRGVTYYVLRYPSASVMLPVDTISDEDADDIQNELLHVTVIRRNNLYFATDIEPLLAKSKMERGKELMDVAQSENVDIGDIPAIGYGYITPYFDNVQYNDNIGRLSLLTLLRFFTTIKVQGTPLHAFELTTPNTGKTTFAVRNMYLVNWGYIDEPPSFARLIMDAKTGALGMVFRNDGVFIDEIDKYGVNLKDVLHIMLTGMSHGVWQRGKGDTSAPSIVRKIPVYFAGNREAQATFDKTEREYVKNVLLSMKLYPSLVDALLDRVGIVIVNEGEINASDYISGYVIADSYLRGYIEYISHLATQNYKDLGIGKGRERQNINIVNAICTVATTFDDCQEWSKSVTTGFLI